MYGWRSSISALILANSAASSVRFLQPHDIARALAYDREDEADDEARRLAEVAREREESEAAAEAAAVDAALAFAAIEPPEIAAALTNGLSPMRARLVRFVAWLAALEAEHASLVTGRGKYLTSMGVPQMTEAAIRKLIAEDKTGLLSMIASGGTASKHQMRSAERAKLAAKLAADQYAASIAESALVEAEARTDALTKQIEVARGRHGAFVADAIEEAAVERDGKRLAEAAQTLRDLQLKVLGAEVATKQLRGVHHQPGHVKIDLPSPSFRIPGISGATDKPGYVISGSPVGMAPLEMSVQAQIAESRIWLDWAKQLMADPRAKIESATQ